MCKIQKIKSRIDANVYYQQEGIKLGRHTGKGWYQSKSLCQLHSDRHAGTLYINVHTGKFKCYSCDSGSDVVDFHVKKNIFTLKEALKNLGGRF